MNGKDLLLSFHGFYIIFLSIWICGFCQGSKYRYGHLFIFSFRLIISFMFLLDPKYPGKSNNLTIAVSILRCGCGYKCSGFISLFLCVSITSANFMTSVSEKTKERKWMNINSKYEYHWIGFRISFVIHCHIVSFHVRFEYAFFFHVSFITQEIDSEFISCWRKQIHINYKTLDHEWGILICQPTAVSTEIEKEREQTSDQRNMTMVWRKK